MKKIAIIMLMYFILSGIIYAKPVPVTTERLEMAINNLSIALKSDNIGLKNSALYQLVKLKVEYPELNISKAEKEVDKLVQKDNASIIRVNASLVKTILNENPENSIVNIAAADHMDFFNNLYQSLTLASEQ